MGKISLSEYQTISINITGRILITVLETDASYVNSNIATKDYVVYNKATQSIIDYNSFHDKTPTMTSVVDGVTITNIADSAFANKQITGAISIPDSIVTIANNAFYNNAISSVSLGSTTSIGNNAFSNNKITGELVIPNSVTTIGDGAFSGSPSTNTINSLTLSNTITYIGSNAFTNNAITGSLTIPDTLTSLGTSVFANNKITSLTIGSGIASIPVSTFENNTITGALVIPNNVTQINNNAFTNNQITSLTFGTGVTFIGSSAFQNNKIAGALTIPPSCPANDVRDYAFDNNLITEVTLPASWTTYTRPALFRNNPTLWKINLGGCTNMFSATNMFLNCPITNITIGANATFSLYDGSLGINEASFKTFYNDNGKLAGTYNYSGSAWSKTA